MIKSKSDDRRPFFPKTIFRSMVPTDTVPCRIAIATMIFSDSVSNLCFRQGYGTQLMPPIVAGYGSGITLNP